MEEILSRLNVHGAKIAVVRGEMYEMKQKQQEGARLADAAAKKGSKAQQIAAIKAKVRADSIAGPSPRVAGLNAPCCRAAGRDRGGG